MKPLRLFLLILGLILPCAPAAAAVIENDAVPLDLQQFIPCANGGVGETVDLTGPLHVLMTATINRNNFHATFHFQPQGVSGVGSTSGETYHATGVTREDVNEANATFPFVATFVNNFRIIGQKTSDNFIVHENVHVTVTATGALTASIDNFRIDCK